MIACVWVITTAEHNEVVRVFMAWAHLYINLRYVAPTAESVSLAYALYEHWPV